jgi:hypothetical protein
MKSSFKKTIFFALLVMAMPGCKKNYIISDKQAILFQFEYINYAWGYQHNGFYIDNEGNVLTYNNPENWNFPDNNSRLSEAQILENLGKCTRTSIKISQDELQKYSNYIRNIASSKVTALRNIGADAGSLEFLCYQFFEDSETYKSYIIKRDGDFTCENLNFYSKKVVTWMKDINNSLTGT